jgi:hypothetical protein
MALRWATVTLTAVSWLAISNHCALGLATVETHEQDAVSAHDCCASEVPAQPRPARHPTTPCCKTLRALSVSLDKSFVASATNLVGTPLEVITTTVMMSQPPALAHRLLDPGPPGGRTFAESVLQRSILAHAPPFLA